jgi:hypothetical protein
MGGARGQITLLATRKESATTWQQSQVILIVILIVVSRKDPTCGLHI